MNEDKFVHLHTHSTYSFTDGYGLPQQYIDRAKELGQPALAVTDHGNISAHYKWYKGCNKEGIKPILGCEMYIVATKEDIHEKGYNHIIVIAKNEIGYRNLTKLVTKSWCENFYYKPRITFDELFEHQEGLIVLSGCLSSPFMKLLKDGKLDEADQLFEEFNNKIDDFYIEVQPIGFDEGKPAYEALLKLYDKKLKKKGFKMVATNDCHYVCDHQHKTQEVLLCIQSNNQMSNPDRWKFDQNDFYLKSRKEMEETLSACFPDFDFTEALDNSVKIAESINFTFPKAEPIKFPMKENKMKYLREITYAGMVKRGLIHEEGGMFKDKDDNPYIARIERELDLIDKKDFVDYFLVIADLIQWAKEKGILVGPARGSAAGSLACYALAITEVEPIRYGLIFERFIDINRADLPDIDIDFEDVRRDEVKHYLEKKYGIEKVGTLPTFAEFQGRSALDDVGRVFGIPFKVVDQVKNAIIERSGGDSRASFTLEDTFTSTVFEYPKQAMKEYPDFKYAIELEGQLRQMGQHAAGVIISNAPLTDFCALYKVKENYVTSLDYKDVTDIGLLKIDVLGLNTLSVISEALRQIKKRHKKSIDIYHLPLDDKKTYKGFCDGKLFGVFQFDGQAVNQVCRQIKPKEFEALSAISALARPGPLNSGNTTEYIMRRAGKSPTTYVHPIMESITGDSYGIVIYQEQVMRIMREIGKMSWEDTSAIRKMMSRSLGVEAFNAFKDKFMPGAIESGLSPEVASKIWEEMCHYGSWSFNKSHSVSYSIISYWTMWLKVHYPIEFYGSILALTHMEEKKKKIMKEYKREGYTVLGVDINKSKQHFVIDGKGLRVGFEDIKGIGPKAADAMVDNQPYHSYTEFNAKTRKKRVTETTKKHLIDLGAFDNLPGSKPQITLFGEEIPEFTKQEMPFSERFAVCPWDMEFDIVKTWTKFLESHPEKFKQLPISIESLAEMKTGWDEPEVILWGIASDKNLRDVRETSASKGKAFDPMKYKAAKLNERLQKVFGGATHASQAMMDAVKRKSGTSMVRDVDYVVEDLYEFANFVLEDETDFVTVRVSHLKFPQHGKLIFEDTRPDDVIMIKGRMGAGIRMFFANKIINLRKMKEELEAKESGILKNVTQ